MQPAELGALSDAANSTGPGGRGASTSALWRKIVLSSLTTTIRRHWRGMRPVRLVSFEKNGGTNWQVPWHQDRVIAVKDRQDVSGYRNWTLKNGVWHCEPPLSILRDMLFVRLHMDASTETNGAMEIALGSHEFGRVVTADASQRAMACRRELTLAAPGDVLVLPMLTLHRSRPSQDMTPRRVLRVDFANCDLPEPLHWAV